MTQAAAPATKAAPPEVFATNLAALRRQNRDLADQLERTSSEPAQCQWVKTPEGPLSATSRGRSLASRHRPMEEARRLVDRVDLVEHPVIVVMGFGVGYHVRVLAEQMGKRGAVIVFEPDLALLRAVLERVDHSAWIEQSNVIILTDPGDRARLSSAMLGAESMVVMGLEFLEHPPSRPRLGEMSGQVTALFRDYVDTCRTTMVTTLLRSVDTVRNQMLNLHHYVAGPGVAPLQGVAAGHPAVIVSAGPSLQRNIARLAEPGVRDRCVIIAVQTTLKPLLAMGVKPHFVTALDYHRISQRFYEELTAEDVEGATLIADPKANPVILDSFPGVVRCFSAGFLDRLLGPLKREMGELPNGATVAHLAVYLARFLGCDPITLIGQDLGFTDGLYYAPGNAIHDVWAPELGPFNTVEMMEWQRIMRHRNHLSERKDVHGRSIFADVQMLTYLQQFERDFAEYQREGIRIIDATEGGIAKQHVQTMQLTEVLDRFATRPLPPLTCDEPATDHSRLAQARQRLVGIRRDIDVIARASRKSHELLTQMSEHVDDQPRVNRLFEKLAVHRKEVKQRMDTFRLLDSMNQLAAYKRLRADRRLDMQQQLEPRQRQAKQIERDLINVEWTGHAADEMKRVIDETIAVLDGAESVAATVEHAPGASSPTIDEVLDVAGDDGDAAGPVRVIGVVPVDLELDGLGRPRDLSASIAGRSVLQATLERVSHSRRLDRIVLVTNSREHVESLINREAINLPIEIHDIGGRPLGDEMPALAVARAFSPTAWRGGIGGMSIYDELFNPPLLTEVLEQHHADAAVLVGPDWPLVDIESESGVDAMVDRHRRVPKQLGFMFTQAAPGSGACLVSRRVVGDLTSRSRNCTAGAMLGYLPHLAQPDPIAREANMPVDPLLRSSLARMTADTPGRIDVFDRLLRECPEAGPLDAVAACEQADEQALRSQPEHLIIELTTERAGSGRFMRSLNPNGRAITRSAMSRELFDALFAGLREPARTVVTFAGVGDPLKHPMFDEMIAAAKQAGAVAVHVRTELAVDRATTDRLISAEPDVISIDLHADRAATYEAMLGGGESDFRCVLENIEYLAGRRRAFGTYRAANALQLPWIVPRMQRCPPTIDDLHPFYDRWMRLLGAAVIEGVPTSARGLEADESTFTHTNWTDRVERRELLRRMVVHSDGGVPIDERDVAGDNLVGRITPGDSVIDRWRDLYDKRRRRFESAERNEWPGVLLP